TMGHLVEGDALDAEVHEFVRTERNKAHAHIDEDSGRWAALVGPPVAPALDVATPVPAEIRRSDHDELETVRPGFIASPRTGRNAHRVPFLELDDLVVELHASAPTQGHVHLFLRLVRVPVGEAVAG